MMPLELGITTTHSLAQITGLLSDRDVLYDFFSQCAYSPRQSGALGTLLSVFPNTLSTSCIFTV